ncbi:MAG: MOSC domain-containing protein [Rhodobacteraceae bacterium]|nr:MOSC domain-containing protein [Paracoccaceae bacterium]
MSDLKTLISTYAKPGRVAWIGLRPERRGQMVPVEEAMITPEGLEGDHARPGKRAVTLVQAEYLPVIGAMLGQQAVAPAILRRNLVVEGINLGALKGRVVQVGSAVLQFEVICAPCSRMEKALGRGGYSAVRGHGGWCASVLEPGRVAVDDLVRPID